MRKLSFLFIIAIFVSLNLTVSFAQKPDEELTKDEAVARIQELQRRVNDLQTNLNTNTGDVSQLQKDLDAARAQLKNCQDSYWAMLGVAPQDVDAFRQRLGVLEGKIRTYQRMSDDDLADKRDDVKGMEDELNSMRGSKIAILPEFYDKIMADARDIKGLYREKKVKSYTVGTWAKDRDCLWNIAGKIEIYGDPFQWPRIWQANTDKISNPDIIHPGEVLTLPPAGQMSSDDMKAERRYWRHKRAATEESKNANTNTNNNNKNTNSGEKGQ